MTESRWLFLMANLGLLPSLDTFTHLMKAYAEPQRHYHTGRHIADCLTKLDSAHHLAQQPALVELALWFHDAIYHPESARNEQDSADWAQRFLLDAGADTVCADAVHSLIMTTRHHAPAIHPDAGLLVDIDLSILGAEAPMYAAFEQGIRQEYSWVPNALYRRKRGEVLAGFLAREWIYSRTVFRQRYEAQARCNLASAMASLQSEI